MPISYSHKRQRDRRRHAAWDARPDADFARIGITRDAAKAAQAALHGSLVLPGDDSYDQDRLLFNPLFNEYPAAIAYCATEADVWVALDFGRVSGLGFAVRSGGHCTAGFSSGPGVLIDVSALKSLVIDPVGLTATVGCGETFGNFFQTLDLYGLHVPGGECPDVCIGGYVQGGGYGFTSVSFGMNCDNVLALRVMLADGSVVVASHAQNRDLFWAMRGGTGGNFGILLAVVYRLRPLGSVWGWALAWPLDSSAGIAAAADALMLLQRSYMRNSVCGSDMTIQVSLCSQNWLDPTAPQPPPGTPLRPYLMARGLYIGDPAKGQTLIQPLAGLPGCIFQWAQSASFYKMNDMLLNYPQGMPPIDVMPFEDKSSRYVSRDLTVAEWTAMLATYAAAPANSAYGYLEFYGGAINAAAARPQRLRAPRLRLQPGDGRLLVRERRPQGARGLSPRLEQARRRVLGRRGLPELLQHRRSRLHGELLGRGLPRAAGDQGQVRSLRRLRLPPADRARPAGHVPGRPCRRGRRPRPADRPDRRRPRPRRAGLRAAPCRRRRRSTSRSGSPGSGSPNTPPPSPRTTSTRTSCRA